MTAPSREPTEAMHLRLAKEMFEIDWPTDKWERHILPRGPDDAARRYLAMTEPCLRALAEQDTAARREAWITGFKEAQQKAALMADKRAPKPLADGKMSATAASAAIACEDLARLIRALTPEPPSEKENEGG